MTPGDPLPPPLPTHRNPLFRRGSSGGCGKTIHPGEDFPMRFTARPRMGGRRAVARRVMRFTARPRVGGRRAAGRWRLCVLLQKVVCVSLVLTCFYWEVFWN